MKNKIVLVSFLLCLSSITYAQNVGIGNNSPGTKLDVSGGVTYRETQVGVVSNAATIPSNVSEVQLTGSASGLITLTAPTAPPNAGQQLIIYNNTTGGWGASYAGSTIPAGTVMEFIYTNTPGSASSFSWVATSPASSGSLTYWGTTGNTGTTASGAGIGSTVTYNFIGNTDAKDLVIATNNLERMRISSAGYVGINTTAPGTSLDVRTTDAIQFPAGSTAQRPSAPSAGYTRFNTDATVKSLEFFDGSQWISANFAQVPIGTITPYGGSTAPSGWMVCDGSAVSRTTYASLFAAIGTTYGVGDGSTTFNLPNMQGKAAFGVGTTAPFNTLGNTGGGISVTPTLTPSLSVAIATFTAALPNHTHSIPAHYHSASSAGASLTTATGTTGSAGAHTHTLNLAQGDQNYSNGSGNTVWGPSQGQAWTTSSSGAHTHTTPSVSVSGTIGLVTGGVSGDAAMTSGNPNSGVNVSISPPTTSVTGTVTSSAVSTLNPYEVLTYIIKVSNTTSSSLTVNVSAGTLGQTLYNNGTNWTPTSNLYNTGTNVGVGTTNPTGLFTVGTGTTSPFTISGAGAITAATGITSSGPISFSNNLSVGGTTAITGATTLSSTLGVTGATTLSGAVTMSGLATLPGVVYANSSGVLSIATGSNLPSGSGSYIQNAPSSQQTGSFNISGTGIIGSTLYVNATGTGTTTGAAGTLQLGDGLFAKSYGVGFTMNSSLSVNSTSTAGSGLALDVNGNIRANTTYYTQSSYGHILQVGDDAWINDVNQANCMGIIGNETGSNGGIYFGTGGAYMYSNGSAYLGIGTTSPGFPLDVETSLAGYTTPNPSYAYGQSGHGPNGGVNGAAESVSIYAIQNVLGVSFIGFSDARLKNVIGQSRSDEDLNTLNKIKITDYTMRDEIRNGSALHKKVIAQELRDVYPTAVKTVPKPEFIPNIYCNAQNYTINGRDITIDLPRTISSDTNIYVGVICKFYVSDIAGKEKEVKGKVTAFSSTRLQITTQEVLKRSDLSERLFVYGTEINDLLAVDYEAVSMLNVSATQELSKQLDEAKAKIDKLEKQNQSLQSRLDEQPSISEFNKLKASIETMQQILGSKAQK